MQKYRDTIFFPYRPPLGEGLFPGYKEPPTGLAGGKRLVQ